MNHSARLAKGLAAATIVVAFISGCGDAPPPPKRADLGGTEAGARRPLITTDHHERRTPIAGATAELLAEALAARRAAHWPVEENLLVG